MATTTAEHCSEAQVRALKGASVQARQLLATLIKADAPAATVEAARKISFQIAADYESAHEAFYGEPAQ
jgi:hypothetical protein